MDEKRVKVEYFYSQQCGTLTGPADAAKRIVELEDAAASDLAADELDAAAQDHGWSCDCKFCQKVLGFLNSISPSLLNTPKRDKDGKAVLTIEKSVAIAGADYDQLLKERESLLDFAVHDARAALAQIVQEMKDGDHVAVSMLDGSVLVRRITEWASRIEAAMGGKA